MREIARQTEQAETRGDIMKAVILAGGADTGRCPLSMIRPRPLYPVLDGVLLELVVQCLGSAGGDEIVVCANGRSDLLSSYFARHPIDGREFRFHNDRFPRGTAGCVHDVLGYCGGETFLVLEGGLVLDSDLGGLLAEHRRSGAALTVGAVAAANAPPGMIAQGNALTPLGAYVVEPEAFALVPDGGYFDIKEQLIPSLHERHLGVNVSIYGAPWRRITNAESYGLLIRELLSGRFGRSFTANLRREPNGVWLDESASIAPSARVAGPVLVCRNATIGPGASIAGPAVVGTNAIVEERAMVAGSVLWPNVQIGERAAVDHSIITDGFCVKPLSTLTHCIAIDHELSYGDAHCLNEAGYLVRAPSAAGRSLWRSFGMGRPMKGLAA